MGGHRAKRSDSGPDRAEILAQILSILDAACLEIGERITLAQTGSIDEWFDWVACSTPFTIQEARMLRAIHLAYTMFPQETVDNIPKPWQALWTIPAGRIGQGMPRSAASSKRVPAGDLLAARLLQGSPDDLSTDVYEALAAWLHERSESRDQA